ncbi:MAG: right-handed parallel beta-helix repeat-containing protein, partial [Pseudomonadota bacterium]
MTIFNVSNSSQLMSALNQASGGDEIRLASGDYGELNLRNVNFSSEVTITSANPGSMASFSKLRMDDASNVTFDAIKFDYDYSNGDNTNISKFRIEDSSNIKILNSVFDGDTLSGSGTSGDGAGYGRGLHVVGSEGVDIINTEFHSWWKALNIGTSTDVNVIGNNIHAIRSDGINIGRSHDVLIENNYIHDFYAAIGSEDHRDMIQIKRSSEDGSSGITIRSNVFDMGDGNHTQTIFAGGDNANPNDPTDWHRDIVIDNNLIYNSHTHGITFSLTDGLTVTNNTLISIPREGKGGITIPRINIGDESKNVTIEKNIAGGLDRYDDVTGWTVKNNVEIQNSDPSDPGYYDDIFVYYATTANDGFNQFGIQDGSLADQLNAGSSLADLLPFSYDEWVGSSSTDVPPPSGDTGSGQQEEQEEEQQDQTGSGSGTGEDTSGGSGGTTDSDDGDTGSSGNSGGAVGDQTGV